MRLTLKGQSPYFAPPQLSCSGMKFLYASLKIFSVTLFYTLLSYWSTIPFFFFFFFSNMLNVLDRIRVPLMPFPRYFSRCPQGLHGLFTLQLYSWKSLDRPNTETCLCFVLQMVRNFRKPLIVVGPKLLLRLPVRDQPTEKRTGEKIMPS